MLPALGLRATLWVAVACNGLVAALAWRLESNQRPLPAAQCSRPAIAGASASLGVATRSVAWILPLVFMSGAVAMLHEVLWTRLLQRVVGGSLQAYGVMVASFLLGIAIGGAVGARLAVDRPAAARAFAASQLAVALAAMLAWYLVTTVGSAPSWLPARQVFGLLVLLPLALAIGVSYPLAVRILADGAAEAAAASARVYSWNTCGAIAGALAGGFWLLPTLRYEGTLQLAVSLSLALLVLSAVLLVGSNRWQAAAVASALAALELFQPSTPQGLLRISALRGARGEILYYDVGRTADVVVMRNGSQLELRSNGLPEATTVVRGAAPVVQVETAMGLLPVRARPNSRSALIVGYGGGNVVSAMPSSVRTLDIIELEPKIISANRAMSAWRDIDPLTDARVHLIYNDARGALALTEKRYDLVVSQPSHPWTAGASHLYTREFMRQASQHLNPGGVFVQWMGAEFTDATLMRSLVATLQSVYREVQIYRPTPSALLFLASDTALPRQAGLVMVMPEIRHFSSGAAPITDDDNRFATDSVYERGAGLSVAELTTLLALGPDAFLRIRPCRAPAPCWR